MKLIFFLTGLLMVSVGFAQQIANSHYWQCGSRTVPEKGSHTKNVVVGDKLKFGVISIDGKLHLCDAAWEYIVPGLKVHDFSSEKKVSRPNKDSVDWKNSMEDAIECLNASLKLQQIEHQGKPITPYNSSDTE